MYDLSLADLEITATGGRAAPYREMKINSDEMILPAHSSRPDPLQEKSSINRHQETGMHRTKTHIDETIEVTVAMEEAGLAVLRNSGITDEIVQGVDNLLVSEIYRAMETAHREQLQGGSGAVSTL